MRYICALIGSVEAGGKVRRRIFGSDAEKSDPKEYTKTKDLTLGKDQETPRTVPSNRPVG